MSRKPILAACRAKEISLAPRCRAMKPMLVMCLFMQAQAALFEDDYTLPEAMEAEAVLVPEDVVLETIITSDEIEKEKKAIGDCSAMKQMVPVAIIAHGFLIKIDSLNEKTAHVTSSPE